MIAFQRCEQRFSELWRQTRNLFCAGPMPRRAVAKGRGPQAPKACVKNDSRRREEAESVQFWREKSLLTRRYGRTQFQTRSRDCLKNRRRAFKPRSKTCRPRWAGVRFRSQYPLRFLLDAQEGI